MVEQNSRSYRSPNPEKESAMKLAIAKGKEMNATLLWQLTLMATVYGIVVKNSEGEYVILNETKLQPYLHNIYFHLEKSRKAQRQRLCSKNYRYNRINHRPLQKIRCNNV
jgi:hypothetical protein